MASCPGGTASNVVTFLARADVALSVMMTTVSTLAAAVATPLLTQLLVGTLVPVDALALTWSTFQVSFILFKALHPSNPSTLQCHAVILPLPQVLISIPGSWRMVICILACELVCLSVCWLLRHYALPFSMSVAAVDLPATPLMALSRYHVAPTILAQAHH